MGMGRRIGRHVIIAPRQHGVTGVDSRRASSGLRNHRRHAGHDARSGRRRGRGASFNGTNGKEPGGLTLSGNTLYGTTSEGGANSPFDNGAVFSVPVGGGNPTLLVTFDGGDGECPGGGLTLSGNTLYGATIEGGVHGFGTIFALTVPEPSTVTLLLGSAACLLGYAWRRRKMGNRALMIGALASVLASDGQRFAAQGVFNMPVRRDEPAVRHRGRSGQRGGYGGERWHDRLRIGRLTSTGWASTT